MNDRAAHLIHTRFKRDTGTRAGFFKYHGQGAVVQGVVRLITLEFVFNKARALEHIQDFVVSEVIELQEVAQGRCGRLGVRHDQP